MYGRTVNRGVSSERAQLQALSMPDPVLEGLTESLSPGSLGLILEDEEETDIHSPVPGHRSFHLTGELPLPLGSVKVYGSVGLWGGTSVLVSTSTSAAQSSVQVYILISI